MVKVIGVRFKAVGKIYYFDPDSIELKAGDGVIVETARGVEYGDVVLADKEIDETTFQTPLKKVLRKALESDYKHLEENKIKEREARKICIEKINANSNPYSWDEMTAALQLLPDETTTIAFHMDDLSEAVSFRVTSMVTKNEERKTSLGKEIGTLADEMNSLVDEITDDDAFEAAKEAIEVSKDLMEVSLGAMKALKSLSE